MIETTAEVLDFFRSRTLRLTLQIEALRPFFYNRSLRLLSLFIFATTILLVLSIAFPLWVLLIGPLVYGVPHIFSSIRYFHYALANGQPKSPSPSKESRQRFFAFGSVFLILIAVFSYRLFVTADFFGISSPQLSEWKGSSFVELIATGVTFLLGVFIYRKSWNKILSGLFLLLPFAAIYFRFPAATIGAMVLIHNFVAFVYWILASKTSSERRVAWLAFGSVSLVTALIFMGVFDGAYRFIEPARVLNFANLTISDTGKLIAPWSQQEKLWLHACIAFAFGQALHYFVWLKAIPDQYHYHEAPTSFRQSWGLLRTDFGTSIAGLLIILTIGSVVFWSFLEFQQARLIYFCLASYHGYLEIAGLGLARRAHPDKH
jgi:hypothetical protein